MSERTRIRKIQVSKLFGIFDHEIPLNLKDRITIIHGPNGYGKTAILQMLEGLFSRRWDLLCHVPFDELVVEFEDGGSIRVKRKNPRSSGVPGVLQCSYVDKLGAKPRVFKYEPFTASLRTLMLQGVLTKADPVTLNRINEDTWHDTHTNKVLNTGEVLDLYGTGDPLKEPGWMKPFRARLGLHLIRTERLGVIGGKEPAVRTYSSELAASIKSLLADYASRSQELDSTFLDRLLEEGKAVPLSLKTIQVRLKQIEDKRAKLMAVGFLDQERETHKPPPKLDEAKRDVLSVYIDHTERKLGVFDEMARKVQLLTDAINKRFKYKRMRVSKDEGFIFESAADSERIPLDSLSSGEQHELVLLYELLFKVSPDTLVLIDEPEISLHLAWQQQFLGDLVEMVKLSSFDVLIATHSPGIINKRWDLTVELKGPDLGSDAR